MGNEIKISRKAVYVGVAVLIMIVIGSVYWFYNMENEKETEINNYKLNIYNSLICQFSCPIEETRFQNETKLLPDTACLERCTERLKMSNLRNDTYSKEELLSDNLFVELDGSILECKGLNRDAAGSINYSSYYNCNLEKLYAMKERYDYLN